MKRAVLLSIMMLCLAAYGQQYHNGIRGISAKMPSFQTSQQTDDHNYVNPLTTAVKINLEPPERGTNGLDPSMIRRTWNKPPERGTNGLDPSVIRRTWNKPPERGNASLDPAVIRTTSHKPHERGTSDFLINPVAIGQAGNAYGFAYTRNTFLWADQNINSITFIHRMGVTPGTGYLAYDISRNGGQDWSTNVQVYDPTKPDAYNGRYPQGGIYNPPGNTDPDQAYFHYFAPTLDGSNTGGTTNWGGYGYGVKKLADGAASTQTNRTTVPPYYQYLPAGFTITQTGEAWMVDESSKGNTTGYTYAGELIIGHGIWDPDLEDFSYTYERMALAIDPDDEFNDWKIAFSPDGQIGWILCLTNLADNLEHTGYHPVLFRSTDAGQNWEGPFEVQLGGEYGLPEVQEFISDENLAVYYNPDPAPPREEVDYGFGYEGDLSVDAWGNPHFIGVVMIADNTQGLIYPAEGYMAMFHIWSEDLGQNWQAFNLCNNKRWDAVFPASNGDDMEMYPRPQVATTQDGSIVFFSWLDTEDPNIDDNSQPDIFFREFFPATGMHGESVINVTNLSAAMWSAYNGCMSHYVFAEVNGDQYTCTIPFVYEEMTNRDPSLPVQFYYIPDFTRTYTVTGIDELEKPSGLEVSQNYPNPLSSYTTIRVNTPYKSVLKLEIFNLAGARVYTEDLGCNLGPKEYTVSPSHLSPGIYFYKISTQFESITRKMVISQ